MVHATASIQTAATPPHIVERPRLTQLLDEATARIILLIAPAGYGKTTLARQWLSGASRDSVWYRATSSSRDVAPLASGLAQVASAALDIPCTRIEQRLRGSSSPNDQARGLGMALGDDLVDWPRNTWLVLDDYQALASSPPAEDFVQALHEQPSIHVLITGRERPRWISTRDILYGSVFELGQSALAMTHDEAAAALKTSSNSDRLSGLVALAEGWPAVIGLASLTSASIERSPDEVPGALYDFFAEELYRELDETFRRDVCELALASCVTMRLASSLFGQRAAHVLQEAERRGFLTRQETQYEMHPLLRQFLLIKLTELDASLVTQLATTICKWEIAERNWDEALQLADRFSLSSLLFEVIEASLDDALAQGRVASVEEWIEIARHHDPTSSTISLVEMEIGFRRHQWDEARSHAMRLTSILSGEDPRTSRALQRLGQIGHLDDRYEEAVRFLDSARATAQTSRDLRAALWSQFLALSDHGDREKAQQILEELRTVPRPNADDLLRLSQGELHLATRWGGAESELRRQSGALSLIDHSIDPVVRTGFLQTYGIALILTARYDDAIKIGERQLEEAKLSGLEWVTPHALELRGGAQWGLRDFDGALLSLREASRLSALHADLHGQLNAAVLMARTHLAQGAPGRALETTDLQFDRLPGPSMQGDFLSVRALAHACLGDREKALELADASEACTEHVEARVVRAFARAIPVDGGTRAGIEKKLIGTALEETHVTENYDAFVLAYRACPAILPALAEVTSASAAACRKHVPTSDYRLAERAGLKLRAPFQSRPGPLTAREQEVLSLLRSGLSNREIARALWIAESTAKVHVRNVLRKLGARTRAEAVVISSGD
jgi:LuxR family maltose regulon positive regulatory protein